MGYKKIILLISCVLSLAAHKFYISTTNVTYSEKDKTLQMVSYLFLDDMITFLQHRHPKEEHLADNDARIKELTGKYLLSRLQILVEDKEIPLRVIGVEIKDNTLKCYVESEKVKLRGHKVILKNKLLIEEFREQQNVVNFEFSDEKYSAYLSSTHQEQTIQIKK